MKNNYAKRNAVRPGIKDIWNAYLTEGTKWSASENPVVETTAISPPKQIISYGNAEIIHESSRKSNPNYKVDAFIHFYIDDKKFDGNADGIWANPEKFFRLASHFAGVIGPDFSIYADFPKHIWGNQIYRARVLEYACSKRNIPVIVNARWGSPKTWEETIYEFPENSMLAIGIVGSRVKYLENQFCFNEGFKRLLDTKNPHTLVVVGSANYPCFEEAKKRGIQIVQFDGETAAYYKNKRGVKNE